VNAYEDVTQIVARRRRLATGARILEDVLAAHRCGQRCIDLRLPDLQAAQFAMMLPAADRRPALVMGGLSAAAFYWLDPIALRTYGDAVPAVVQRAVAAGATLPLLIAVVVPGLYYLFRFRDIPSVAGRYAATVTGIFYAGYLTSYLAKLKLIDPRQGGDTVLIVLLVAWLADTGGYFAGRFLGKTKLYEAVSPTYAGSRSVNASPTEV